MVLGHNGTILSKIVRFLLNLFFKKNIRLIYLIKIVISRNFLKYLDLYKVVNYRYVFLHENLN